MGTRTITKLERRYARALLAAVQRGAGQESAQQVSAQLLLFADAWERESLLAQSLLNPMFEKGEREKALVELAKRSGMSDIVIRFLQVCFQRDRLDVIPGIAAAFQDEAQRAAGIVPVEVTTAQNISHDEQRMIESTLGAKISGSLRFSWNVDTSLLGGMIVRYQGKVLDGSLTGRLEQIERRMDV